MQWNLQGKSALVCGASRGIGRGIALAFAESGAQVAVCARSASGLEETLTLLPGEGHVAVPADFDAPDAAISAIAKAKNAFGGFHILVNNTGGPAGGAAIDAEPGAFEKAFAQHLSMNHRLVQLCLEGMKAEKFGRIINVISTSVREPIPGLGVSNTIRGAVASWAKTISKELAPFGITVNNVLPGATETDRLTAIIEGRASKQGLTKEAVTQTMLSKIPVGRFANVEEIAAAAAFLASPAASYVNGVSMPVDGGRLASI